MQTQAVLEKLLVAAILIVIIMAIYQLIMNAQFDPVAVSSGITMMFSAYSAHRHVPRLINAKYSAKGKS